MSMRSMMPKSEILTFLDHILEDTKDMQTAYEVRTCIENVRNAYGMMLEKKGYQKPWGNIEINAEGVNAILYDDTLEIANPRIKETLEYDVIQHTNSLANCFTQALNRRDGKYTTYVLK